MTRWQILAECIGAGCLAAMIYCGLILAYAFEPPETALPPSQGEAGAPLPFSGAPASPLYRYAEVER